MKKCKKIIMTLLTATLVFALTAGSVLAAEEEYTYTVRFSAGVQGNFNEAGLNISNEEAVIAQSADEIIIKGLKQNDVVSFNAQAGVDLPGESKYYVQGARLSGRDNNTAAAVSITVDKDADYVVAYGIKGEMTSYTVNYYHEDGSVLAPADTFYGNVGEKPVVAYKYIEDYVPQVYGYTKTLSANAAENVFNFIYEDAPTGEIVEVVVPGGDDDDQAGTGDGQTGTDDGQTPGGDDGNTPDDGQTPGGDDANQPGGTGEDDTPGEGDQIVDLDEEVPQANVGGDDVAKAVPLAAGIAVAVIAVIAIIVIIMLVRKNLASRV